MNAAGERPMLMRKSASHGEAGYARRPHDAYFTEAWVTQAFLAAVDLSPPGKPRRATVVWEPACGDGRMALELARSGYFVVSSDIADWGFGSPGVDFLDPGSTVLLAGLPSGGPDAIVTNPPFGTDARRFIQRALNLTKEFGGKVAMLQRHEFDAPATNHPLFSHPFAAKLVLPRRPKWSDEDKASPRFPYAWYFWDWRHKGPATLRYLPDLRTDKSGGLLTPEEDAADSLNSYHACMEAIGEQHRAGRPIPDRMRSHKEVP